MHYTRISGFCQISCYNVDMELCTSFGAIVSPACRVLVLGSMPGIASLRAEQYYAHPRNAFWPILYALWDEKPSADYDERLGFALLHRVAIWDVAHTCLREGSSDASIRDVVPNDFAALFARFPAIHTIFHNGQLSRSLFDRLAKDTAAGRARILLPSTSPAYTMTYENKLAAWQSVRRAAEQENAFDEYA